MDSVTADIRRDTKGKNKNYSYYIIVVMIGFFALFIYGMYIKYNQYFDAFSVLVIALIVLITCLLLFIPKIIIAISSKIISNLSLVVNDEKAYGYNGLFFKKEFSVPIEQITNIAIVETPLDRVRTGKTIVIDSASSKMVFPYVQNATDVLNFALERIKEYKTNYGNVKPDNTQPTQIINNELSEADELAKFKKLLDEGVITQEEFDAKKKQILGL